MFHLLRETNVTGRHLEAIKNSKQQTDCINTQLQNTSSAGSAVILSECSGARRCFFSPAVEVDTDARPTLAVPGAVGVPGEQTVWLRLIAAAVGQGQLENLRAGADVQVLLTGGEGGRKGRRQRTGPVVKPRRREAESDEKQEGR